MRSKVSKLGPLSIRISLTCIRKTGQGPYEDAIVYGVLRGSGPEGLLNPYALEHLLRISTA